MPQAPRASGTRPKAAPSRSSAPARSSPARSGRANPSPRSSTARPSQAQPRDRVTTDKSRNEKPSPGAQSQAAAMAQSFGKGVYDFVIGDSIRNVKDAVGDFKKGNYGSAALHAGMGLLNVLPQAKGAKLGAKIFNRLGGDKLVGNLSRRLGKGLQDFAGGPKKVPGAPGGPKGPVGPQGPKGPQGPQGPRHPSPGENPQNAANGRRLAQDLRDQQQRGALKDGKVEVQSGHGTRSELRDTPRLKAQHGGEKWQKVNTPEEFSHRGTRTHAYRDAETGKIVEPKLKTPGNGPDPVETFPAGKSIIQRQPGGPIEKIEYPSGLGT